MKHFLSVAFIIWNSISVIRTQGFEEDAELFEPPQEPTRILYNIGHMANDIPQANQFLADGANGLEVDVRFDGNGKPNRLYHGVPCDCFRNCVKSSDLMPFLSHMRERSTPGSPTYTEKLALLFLDLKLKDVDDHKAPLYAAGDAVAATIIENIYLNGTGNSSLWILVGIPSTRQAPAVEGFRDAFKRLGQQSLFQRVGFEVSDEQNMDEVQQMFRGLQIERNIWQGDGITNCVAGRTDARLRRAITKRDNPTGEWVRVDKVYRWTIDTKTAMRHTLRLGVDGIMTNDPDDVLKVSRESEFSSRFRMAINSDNPFEKIPGPGPLRVGCQSNYCWKDCTFSGKWCWTALQGCKSKSNICNTKLSCSGSCGKRRK